MSSNLVIRLSYALASVVTLPLFLVTLLTGLNLVNPMGLAFLTSFHVVNRSGENLWVTPIGAVGSAGKRRTLPLAFGQYLYLMKPFSKDIALSDGERQRLVYDWDDIQFSEILLRRENGEYRVLETGLHPTENQYRRPAQTEFVVENMADLPLARELHLAALAPLGSDALIQYGLALIGLVCPYFLFKLLMPKRRVTPLPGEQPFADQ